MLAQELVAQELLIEAAVVIPGSTLRIASE
jgi:hypothetical protein